jgi:MFS family permease
VHWRERVGPLAERDFRLLFSATMITTAGDRLAAIALAFAVLDLHHGGVVDLGIVLAARQVTQMAVVLFGGVLSDRLPRNLMLAGASLVQAGAQAVTAALVLSGTSSIAAIVVAQIVYGAGDGLVEPAERGLVFQIVSPARLQQANALQGLSRNVMSVIGYAVGGAIVVAGSPGVALAVDAGSFVTCAALLARIRVPARPPREQPANFLSELREGWHEFSSRTWLWSSVVLFGVGNLAFAGVWLVLGPAIAKQHLGGAGAWAAVLTASGIGAVVGGFAGLRYKPERPLLACCIAPLPVLLQMAGLALHVPVAGLAAITFVGGVGLAVHFTLWTTVFQENVPEHAQSRVTSYDYLGSFVLIPLGTAIVGPIATVLGTTTTIWAATAVSATCMISILFLPSVRALRRVPPAPAPAPV